MKPLEDVRKLQSRPQAYGTPQAEEIGPEASDKVLSGTVAVRIEQKMVLDLPTRERIFSVCYVRLAYHHQI